FLISILWLVVFTKKLFFWVWLWQLKEYHIGRFLDHFRTEKGKKLLLSPWLAVKAVALFGIFFYPHLYLFYFVLAIFFFESLLAIRHSFRKTLKIPVLTRKTSLILTAGMSLELLALTVFFNLGFSLKKFTLYLLGLDILAPLVFSFLVLLFQPLTVALREQLIRKAKKKRERFKDLLAIGITGSYGKTSTKEFLATILAKKYKVLKTKEHQNSEVGISRRILRDLNEEYDIFVVEMGAYNKGGIKLLCDIAKPRIGIVTGVNEQHLSTFGTMENLLSAEGGGELAASLPEDGLAIFNYDNPLVKKDRIKDYNARLKNVKFYSLFEKESDLWAKEIKIEKEALSFKAVAKDGEQAIFNLNLLGIHNIHNMLAAAICAKYLGMGLAEIAKAAAQIEPWQSGMQLKEGTGGLNIIDATYSANPSGVMSHLDYLKVWPGKRVLAMPCLIELGKASKEVHQRIGKKIADVCDLAIITTKDRFKEIKEGAGELPQTQPREREAEVVFMEKPAEIVDKIKSFAKPGDVILLESRVPSEVINSLIR
ncbi:MAG: hypothetical protein DRZ76_01370, partial [Candidatus Nealsonbacteria bacterium]